MSDITIKSKNLNVFYGEKQALFDVNLDLNEKEVTALIGPSGCGKSTFIRCINRMNDVIDICTVTGNIEIDGIEINDKKLIEETLSKKENSTISINTAKKGTKAKVINMAEKNAKESLNRKIYETNNNKDLFEKVAKKFNLKNGVSLVEVYDNSHIQGTNSVGALIAYGDEGFIKKRYRKFNIKIKKNEQDDYGRHRLAFCSPVCVTSSYTYVTSSYTYVTQRAGTG